MSLCDPTRPVSGQPTCFCGVLCINTLFLRQIHGHTGTIICGPRTRFWTRIRFSSRRNQDVGRFKKFLAGFLHQNRIPSRGNFRALAGFPPALAGIPRGRGRVTNVSLRQDIRRLPSSGGCSNTPQVSHPRSYALPARILPKDFFNGIVNSREAHTDFFDHLRLTDR